MTLDARPSDAELLRRLEQKSNKPAGSIMLPPASPPSAPTAVTLSGVRPRSVRGAMNKTEARVAAFLETERAKGHVLAFYFDAFTFRLADDTHYRPDFVILMRHALGDEHVVRVLVLEAKGHWEDDARVKIKVAAEQYPHFTFIAARRLRKGEAARAQLANLDGHVLDGFEIETFASRRT